MDALLPELRNMIIEYILNINPNNAHLIALSVVSLSSTCKIFNTECARYIGYIIETYGRKYIVLRNDDCRSLLIDLLRPRVTNQSLIIKLINIYNFQYNNRIYAYAYLSTHNADNVINTIISKYYQFCEESILFENATAHMKVFIDKLKSIVIDRSIDQ